MTGDRTDGRLSVVEMHQPEGHVTPERIHEETDGMLHVLEGALTAHGGDHQDGNGRWDCRPVPG